MEEDHHIVPIVIVRVREGERVIVARVREWETARVGLEANADALTNFEVLDFFRAKGASQYPTRVIAKVAQSEYKVYDCLVDTPTSIQTRENINEFLTGVKQHDLAKGKVLNILNLRLAAEVEIYCVSIKRMVFPFILQT
ncbi:hypothetical protein RJT34_03531 [Clitoria ternatea]|uniref:RNA polymerase Rpb4/RPC9 core domain-containing protein n=1 Tax=Clitoria ternatea TaxID=43366 RepID=A0AAN9KKD7_CLITE